MKILFQYGYTIYYSCKAMIFGEKKLLKKSLKSINQRKPWIFEIILTEKNSKIFLHLHGLKQW